MSGFVTLLIDIAISLPGVVVAGIGLVLSITNRRRLGASSGAMLIAFVVLLIAALVGLGQLILSVFGPRVMLENHWSYSSLGLAFGVVNAVHMLISTAGWVVLLIAIFRRRDTATKPATPAWNRSPVAGAAQYGATAPLPGQPSAATTPQFGAGQQPGAAAPQSGAGQQPGAAQPQFGAAEPPAASPGEHQPGGWTAPGGPSPY
ncbi:hypothetical protein AB0I55_10790 [Actinocatenispora sera]|uniref:hypothetical protein n=1 Tax=Actinocatenispora sera TaxID=390989 RepID=UPI0033EE6953